MSDDLAQLARDRYEIGDAVHRFTWGFDHDDIDAFRSAFSEDAVVDLGPIGSRVGLEFSVIEGREAAVTTMMGLVGGLDTSHTASNMRIEVDGDRATLTCNVMAQHFRPGEGFTPGASNYLMMNLWSARLVRDGDRWRFARLTVDSGWAQGDIGAMLALAPTG